jgi:hypothetical protein
MRDHDKIVGDRIDDGHDDTWIDLPPEVVRQIEESIAHPERNVRHERPKRREEKNDA